MNKAAITQIKGEVRNFGGNLLFIDLIPRNCWLTSIRTSIVKSDWDRLRTFAYARTNNHCECCQSDVKLQAHQRWHYDQSTKTQRLMRIIALCQKCHLSTHMGRAKIVGYGEEAINHIMSVRNWTREQYQAHESEAFALWRQRNKIKWRLDLEIVTSNNLHLTKKMLEAQKNQDTENDVNVL